MKRIDTSTRAVDLFGAGKDGFKDGDLANGVVPTDFNAAWPNGVQEEIARAIEAAGIVLSGVDLTQLTQAIRKLPGGRLIGVRVITFTQVYTPTAGTGSVMAYLQGPGGGGGGCPNGTTSSAGGGGGAGAYGIKYITSGFAGFVVTPGVPGVGVFGADGTAGTTASFGALMTCSGGAGGKYGVNRSAPNYSSGAASGGVATGADLGVPGGIGAVGLAFGGSASSGSGASSPYGVGGIGATADSTIAASGNNAGGFGAGGGGAVAINNGSAPKGGDGSAGVCLVMEYSA